MLDGTCLTGFSSTKSTLHCNAEGSPRKGGCEFTTYETKKVAEFQEGREEILILSAAAEQSKRRR